MKQFLKRKFRRFVKRFVSYAIRLKLVFYLKIKKIDNVIAFHTVFSELDNSKVVNYFLPKCEHRHQLSNREYLLLEIIKRMNRILVILTLDIENLPANFQEILRQEREVVTQWKKDGVLEQLYLRPTKNGAVLIFKDIDEEKANQLMTTLPFYPLRKSMEIFPLIKDSEI